MIQVEYEFSDGQDHKGNNTTTIGNTVSEMNAANSAKTGWWPYTRNNTSHGTQAEIGGMLFVAEVCTDNVAGGNLTAQLKTAATNNLNATGTVIASVTINNGAAIGNRYAVKIPAGTKRLKYLGAVCVNSGNVSAANLNMRLTTGAGAESPSK